MISSAVARRYAKALLDLGDETHTVDQLVDEVSRFAGAWQESQELRSTIANPLVPHEAKKAILSDVADKLTLSVNARNTIFLLNDRRRITALPDIASALREMNDARKGVVRAEVTSARPLSEEYYAKLKTELERVTGKKIAIDKKEDASLIAGVIARIGDTVYDGSLRSRLHEMKTALTPN